MKKIVLLVTIIGCNLIVAQTNETNETSEKLTIEKKTWIIGGSVNFNKNSIETQASFNNEKVENEVFKLNINGGYTITENIAIGLNLGYSLDDGDNSTRIETYSIGPYVKMFKGIRKKIQR